MSFAANIGRRFLGATDYWLSLVTFTQLALRDWMLVGGLRNQANRQSLVTQIIFTGVGALPIVFLIAALTALGLTVQTLGLSGELDREFDIYARLGHLVVFEVAPLMTAIVIISRSASAIVVDIGNMKLRGEIDGLMLLGIDIDDYIVAPRIIAGAICQLVLAVYFAFVALYGGIVVSALINDSGHLLAMDDVMRSLQPSIWFWFVVKNLLFGALICAGACYHALQINTNVTTALPQQTQKAIVRTLALVFILSVTFTLSLA